MSDKETSDFSVSRLECSHCGAMWINGQHYWATGAKGNELDLSSLVCNTPHGSAGKCINPQIGAEGGDTWAKRMKYFKELQEEMKEQ